MLQLPVDIAALLAEYEDLLVSAGWGLATLVVLWLVGWWLVVPGLARIVRARNPKNPTLNRAVRRYLRMTAVLIAVVAAAVAAGYGAFLTRSAVVVAAVTVVLGVAGRETIGNLVSGMFLVADPDFNVDDWIAWEGGEGVVESMGFRVTRVRTQNNEAVVVPNTTLAAGQVTRPYGRDDFRVTVELGVDFDEDLEAVIEALREEAVAVGGVVDDPRPTVRALGFDANSVRLRAELWVRDPARVDVVRIRSTFVERIVARFDEMGVAISPASKHELSGELSVDGASSEHPDGSAE